MNATGDALQRWIGRQETTADVITAAPVAALAATLDLEPPPPGPGQPLLPLWHWLYFLPRHRRSDLGPDGHAKRGGFRPPVPLPRRMWAGGQLAFHRPLTIGAEAVRVSTVARVEEKVGRSGRLAFVQVRHEIRGRDESEAALVEHQDLVYREPGASTAAPRAAPAHAA